MTKFLSSKNTKKYRLISKMIKKIIAGHSTIKREVYKTSNSAFNLAMLSKILYNYTLLKAINERAKIFKDEEFGCTIIYDVLSGELKNPKLQSALEPYLNNAVLKFKEKDIYIRINTLKGTVDDIKELKLDETIIPNVYKVCVEKNPMEGSIYDIFQKYKGLVKIQQLASCLPAYILNPTENSVVMDATAAPGNKTTHLCSIMNNTGKIIAVERNNERFKTLECMIQEYGATNTTCVQRDFLTISPEYQPIDYLLLDPSCTGSGIHNMYVKNQNRVNAYRNLQAMLLNHAFKFNPKRLVYSTCSIHQEECEMVIQEALEKNPEYELETIGDFWKTRGAPGYEFSEKVIRSEKTENDIGFFVALFKKRPENK